MAEQREPQPEVPDGQTVGEAAELPETEAYALLDTLVEQADPATLDAIAQEAESEDNAYNMNRSIRGRFNFHLGEE